VPLPLPVSVQLASLKVPPEFVEVKLTVPVGSLAPEAAMSVTVALQLLEAPAGSDVGTQASVVVLVVK
jgi:hypothetical protein